MPRWIEIINSSRTDHSVVRARWCQSFTCKARGLTFRRRLDPGRGLLLVEPAETRSGTAIHMFFVFMDLGVAWLDSDLRVVDTAIARPWRMYWPSVPARFVLEGRPSMLESLAVEDQLKAIDVESQEPLRL
jgi:uncharacterized membrane protein (UPF0127 family)